MPDDSLFHEWRAADRKAHIQEQATTTASLRALEGNGEGPSDEALQKARTLRHSADTLFQRAMHELKLRVARIRGSSPPA